MATTHDAYGRQYDRAPAVSEGAGLGNILLWIVFGGLAGWVASIITGNEPGLGILGNIGVGIVGAFLGGFIADRIGMGGAEGAERPTTLMSFVWAVVGAALLLLLLNFFM